MIKNTLILLLLTAILSGCNFFSVEKKDKNILVKQEIEQLKARGLDTYPLIDSCDSEAKETSKKCFEIQLTQHIYNYFSEENQVLETPKTDTLWMLIGVSKTGELSLKSAVDTTQFSNFEMIKETVENALFDISPIKPGHIKGKPVNCQFKLPIVIGNAEL